MVSNRRRPDPISTSAYSEPGRQRLSQSAQGRSLVAICRDKRREWA